MPRFPHLALPKRLTGLHKPKGGGPRELDPATQSRLNDRQGHGSTLLNRVDFLSRDWRQTIELRRTENLPELPDPSVLPVFLQVDAKKFDIESLKTFGIEIIAEEEDGFIIGASGMDFKSLRTKIQSFMDAEGRSKNQAAQLWDINQDGHQWRVDQILSDALRAKWDSISDDQQFVVDLGIACYVRISNQPSKKKDETKTAYTARLEKWRGKKDAQEIRRDEIARKRQTEFEQLVLAYGGEMGSFVDYDDSFSCRVTVSGKALKDIVLNYQYLFEAVEYDSLVMPDSSMGEAETVNPTLIQPEPNSPKICVIDSGIHEKHRLLAPAIDSATSFSFIPGDTATADIASNGGHGTKVAGAILYPHKIPATGEYVLPFFIQNARILVNLGGKSVLPETLYPPKLMEEIVARFDGTRIFNMSVNSSSACRLVHMSSWAATIDKLMQANDILFILSAGNLSQETGNPERPGIKEHLRANRDYPNYLLEGSSRIGNPAQSCFALTVGSICFDKFDDGLRESFGGKNGPSSFSRTGLGLWGMIKPDVVEYAGDLVREKGANPNLSEIAEISPTLVRSTHGDGSDTGTDIGTSFATPRVSAIAATLQRMYPDESANLYRTLIVQSARLPDHVLAAPQENHIRHYGYGIPDLKRATENSERRITLIASDEIAAKQANVYSVKVPHQMRAPGEDHDILVEVTLSFMARPRRTRRGTRSYLSTWLDWQSSKKNETHTQFKQRILKDLDEPEEEQTVDQDTIEWAIRENKDWSKINGIRRQDSTLQKSWCVMKSHELPENLSIAVIGHSGWESDLSEKVPYSIGVSFEALSADINVYEMIRVENEIEIPIEVEQEVRL